MSCRISPGGTGASPGRDCPWPGHRAQGRFRRGTWSWLHAPRKRWSGPCGLLARPPWSVMLAFGVSCWRLAPVRGLLEGRWGESPMAIEIFRAEAAHGHTDLPRFAVRLGPLGRVAPPRSRFHSHRELPCIARTEGCRNGQFCATSGVGGCRGRSGELVAGTGLGKVCVRSCCRPSGVVTFLLAADQTQELGSH